jgi:hypothetical protein
LLLLFLANLPGDGPASRSSIFKLIVPTIQPAMHSENSQFQRAIAGAASRLRWWEPVLQRVAAIVAVVGVWEGQCARQLLEQCGFITRKRL